jgi:quinoprotein glucose dehydrogenase
MQDAPSPAIAAATDPSLAAGDWLHYGGAQGGTRFSPLDQITPENVGQLQLVWTYRTGFSKQLGPTFEATPLKIGRLVYLCTSVNDVMALDAETGAQVWRFDANVDPSHAPHGACRGVGYFKDDSIAASAQKPGDCAERIITNTIDARLIALDAQTGARCQGFGTNGEVSLLTGMGNASPGYYYVSSAPTITRGKIVLGGWVTDNQYWGEPSGVIRAFDARTGRFAWAFDMGKPDIHTEPKAGETYTLATPNSWGPMSADEGLGLVYVPTGNSTPDYYGAQRRAFDDAYSSAVLALDTETGALRWSFQTAHHDLWDYDVASQPSLIDLPGPNGEIQKALLQPTKRGELFLLDRVTGKPIATVNEHPAPRDGAAPGERLSPTQPFSDGLPSTRGPDLREADMWGMTPFDQLWCRIAFRKARYQGPATPPGLTPNIANPGFMGGQDWGSATVDPDRKLLLVPSNRFVNYNQLIPRTEADRRGLKPVGGEGLTGTVAPQIGTPYAVSSMPFISPIGMPCQAPPYGMLSAIDLSTQKLVWTQRLGNAHDSGPFLLSSKLPILMGTSILGGGTATRTGLLFIAATQEQALRAIDVATGKILWKVRLPTAGFASPAIYRSPESGREFIVIAVGGRRVFGTPPGDYVMAFALPK